MRIDLDQNTEAWYEFRAGGIGSSDIAAIMGKSKFKTAADVYYEKCGLSEQHQTAAMKKGKEKEAEALKEYSPLGNYVPCCWVHDQFNFCRASLDGYNTHHNKIVEIKTPSSSKSKEEAHRTEVPEYYELQIQWQLFVTGAESAEYFAYDADEQKELCTVIFYPDKEIHHEMLLAATKFWQDYEAGICPEVEEKCIEIDEPLLKELVAEYKEVIKLRFPYEVIMGSYDKQLKVIRSNILDFGDDGSFQCDGLKATCVMGKPTYDMERMKRDGIDVKKYIKQQANYFRITLEKENE